MVPCLCMVLANLDDPDDSSDLLSFLTANPDMQLPASFYSQTTVHITVNKSFESVKSMLPAISQFEKFQIGLNVDHLEMLVDGCPKLRHLEVNSPEWNEYPDRSQFMGFLSTLDTLESLQFKLPKETGLPEDEIFAGPITVASLFGHLSTVELLMKNEYSGIQFSISLTAAGIRGHVDVFRLLLEDGRADVTAEDLFVHVVEAGNVEVVRLWLKDGRYDPRVQDSNVLVQAVEENQVDIVKLLLEDGRADPNAQRSRSFKSARLNGHVDIVRVLLKDGRYDPRVQDSNVLVQDVEENQVEMVKLLLEDGRADPNAQGIRSFRFACLYGHVDIVRVMLQDGRTDLAVIDDIYNDMADEGSPYRIEEVLQVLQGSIDGRV